MKSLFILIALIFMAGQPRAFAQRSGGVRINLNFRPIHILNVHSKPETIEYHFLKHGENLLDIVKGMEHDFLTVHSGSPFKLTITKNARISEDKDKHNLATQILYSIETK